LRYVVVDVSIVLKWLTVEEDTSKALALRDEWRAKKIAPCAPDFLLIELHNILWKKVQRGILRADAPVIKESPEFGLNINWIPSRYLLKQALHNALAYRVTVYDSLYVTLAKAMQSPLYTADQALAKKIAGALTAGVITL
jgi:predicted nucleic acid-binding protein